MPEGDTLHGYARRIDAALAGQTLARAYCTRVPLARFEGRAVRGASARGKHLLIEFDTGDVLRTHLRMHGTIRVRDGGQEGPITNPHVRWLLASADKTAVCLDAPSIELVHPSDLAAHPLLSRLGPDLLGAELDLGEILRRLRREPDRAIGAALMDQEALSGIGNVYKSEVLFITEVSPFARIADLDDALLSKVIQTARNLMRRNVVEGAGAPTRSGRVERAGTRSGMGGPRRTTPRGRIAAPYWVYERSGEPCMRCGARIVMQRQNPLARSTYHCPECQRLPTRSHEARD
jgi:endonuclease VIII